MHQLFDPAAICLQTIAQREVAALLGINSGRDNKAKRRRQQNIIVQVHARLSSCHASQAVKLPVWAQAVDTSATGCFCCVASTVRKIAC